MKLARNPSLLSVLVLLLAATFPQIARAALWKTEAQLTAEYGEPVEITRDGESRTFTYQARDLMLEIQFDDGVSQKVYYRHPDRTKPFSAKEIEGLLKANSGGKTWHRGNDDTWELGSPPVARASIDRIQMISTSPEGKETSTHSFEVATVPFEEKETARNMAPDERRPRTGAEKHFEGVLELKTEEDNNQIAIVRDGKSVLEIPWAWRGQPGKAKLEAGQTYEITLRDEELVDIDSSGAFVSDRVHKSHHDRVFDSELFVLVRIKHASEVIFDESVCEVHKTSMQKVKAEIGYGMYGPASKADAVCDKEYPHHADWIRGGCMVMDAKTAFHYVCPECVAATAKYKREHPDETSEE